MSSSHDQEQLQRGTETSTRQSNDKENDVTTTTTTTTTSNNDEMGYLSVEHCEVYLDPTITTIPPVSKWIDIQIPASAASEKIPTSFIATKKRKVMEKGVNGSGDQYTHDACCVHCNLVLQSPSTQSADIRANDTLCWKGASSSPASLLFDGTMENVKPDPECCSCCSTSNDNDNNNNNNNSRRQRSDAALLMGLVLACQELGHITIQSIRILLQEKDDDEEEKDKDSPPDSIDDADTQPIHDPCRRIATLVVTFSIPEMLKSSAVRKNNNNQNNKRRFFSNSSKPLPPSTQLLLSMMQSDWEYFKTNLYQRRDENDLLSTRDSNQYNNNRRRQRGQRGRRKRKRLFPLKMSLDEVYKRIEGAVYSSLEPEQSLSQLSPMLSSLSTAAPATTLTELPKDILTDHLCAFLRARSLNALRGTCKHLHRTLRSVVPGLKLSLYVHQVKSLSWMRHRETKQITESDFADLNRVDSGDIHRAASAGASVLLRSRRRSRASNEEEKCNAIRISQYNGEELLIRPDHPLSRTVARGGLLCDDPGLGKTITVLSLILQTLGLSTESLPKTITAASSSRENAASNDEAERNATSDERIFAEYWKEELVPEFRCQALNRLLSEFLRSSREIDYFVLPVDPELHGCPDYPEIIHNPICFQDIRRKINSHTYGDSFDRFQADVDLCFRNAIVYNPIGNIIHDAARRLTAVFREKVEKFKLRHIQIAKKSFARASAKPNSAVAALVERNNLLKVKDSLVPSSGTLLVVPSVLVEHWQDQLKLHVNPSYFTNKIPLIFEYTGTNDSGLQMEEILVQCRVKKTHSPFIFIDKTGTKKLPSPYFLAMFQIVITTNQRFTNEWRNGSFEDELKQKSRNDEQGRSNNFDFRSSLTQSEEACPLLKVFWLRMIVDEGHSMGRGKENSAISFASWISAERRWAMTGTPTRQAASSSGLSNILNLMRYLQHDFFSRRQGGEAAWQDLVTRGWSRGLLSSFFRLRSLLSLVMVRHTKLDIEELPPPRYKTTILPMSSEEVKTYNTLVCAVQSNLVITSMEGRTSGAQDSLLHRSQAKHAWRALNNVCLVCAGGTQVVPTISGQFWQEFLSDFADCNPSRSKREEVKQYLSRAVGEQLSPCACCGMMLSTLLVFPCGDLVCTECVDHNENRCVVCEKEFDVDLFQRLQPGMDYQWLHNIEEESKRKKIEKVGISESGEEEAVVVMEGGAGLLAPLDNNRPIQRTRKPGDGHECKYNPKFITGECMLCGKEHDGCNLMTDNDRCKICYRKAEPCPSSETKPFYVVQRMLKLYKANQERQRARSTMSLCRSIEGSFFPLPERRPLKVIVFSQFRKVLNMTGDRLLRRFGTECVAEYWGRFRKQELSKFVHNEDCFCMLLGKDGSEGLDLSFVTHIFFLEQVWDKSLEHQAVARAWRMGAKGSVEVETLVAESTVEQTMFRLEKSLVEDSNEGVMSSASLKGMQSVVHASKSTEYKRAKVQFLLKGLKLITDASTTSFGMLKGQPEVLHLEEKRGKPPPKKPRKFRVRFEVDPKKQF